MFRPITEEGLKKGVAELWAYKAEHNAPVRNDELITLVVASK